MRFGMNMPVTTQVPGGSQPWEAEATVDDVAAVAQVADRLGFHHLATSHHVAVPSEEVDDYAKTHGAHFWDPVATFAFLSAHTSRVRFLPYCFVIGLAHPLEIAKSFGTVDLISGGRLILGFGVGNFEPEFTTLGRSFEDRGSRADESLQFLRDSLGRRVVTHDGPHYRFDRYVVSPHAVQAKVPIWIAGHSKRALRRAASFGDGWMPTPAAYGGPDNDEIRKMMAAHDLPAEFQLLLSPGGPLDPAGDRPGVDRYLEDVHDGPATAVNVRFTHRSCSHLIEQMEAFAQLANLESDSM